MKKLMSLVLALCLLMGIPALADQTDQEAHYLFGYIIDVSAGGFELITDNEVVYGFSRNDATQIVSDAGLEMDNAVVVMYQGNLNVDAQAQSVVVSEVTVLGTLYGTVSDATMNTISVTASTDGQVYIFPTEDADVVVGEDGILVGDEIEVAYKGRLSTDAGQAQQLEYTHITVYGQTESGLE